MDLQAAEQMLGAMGTVARWREAHPVMVGTEFDVARMMYKEIERLSREAGMKQGEEVFKLGVEGVLLMMKTSHE